MMGVKELGGMHRPVKKNTGKQNKETDATQIKAVRAAGTAEVL